MANDEGLGLGYRLWWRIRRTLMTFLGPADLGPANDPIRRLEAERAERVERARARRETRGR